MGDLSTSLDLRQSIVNVQNLYSATWNTVQRTADFLESSYGLEMRHLTPWDYLHRMDANPREWLPSEAWWYFQPRSPGGDAAWKHNPLIGFLAMFIHPSREQQEPLLIPFVSSLGTRSWKTMDRFAGRTLLLNSFESEEHRGRARNGRGQRILTAERAGEPDDKLLSTLHALFYPLSGIVNGDVRTSDIAQPLYFLARNEWDECMSSLNKTAVFPLWLLQ